ncbi:MAG: DinB family protein [Chloroflexi bacterium]|nr:DinB family protein [Chloroflexota bacterium]
MSDTKSKIATYLTATRQELIQLIQNFNQEDWQKPTENPGWSTKDLLAHLTASEPSILGAIQRTLRGEPARAPNFDLNRWNASHVERRREYSVKELLEELNTGREATWRLLDTISDEELMREVPASGAIRSTLWSRFRRIADHEAEHLAQLRRALQDIPHSSLSN